MPAIRAHLAATGRYEFMAGTEARSVDGSVVRDDRERRYDSDLVLVCPGAAHGGLTREIAGDLPVRRVRLQMMQTEPLDEPLTTAIADGDSFRYYPAFAGTALDELRDNEPQDAVAGAQPHAAALRATPARRAHHRRHPRVRRTVPLRRGRGAVRLPRRARRGIPRPPAARRRAGAGRGSTASASIRTNWCAAPRQATGCG